MEKWFNKTSKEVEELLETNTKIGLNEKQVNERQKKYGLNEIQSEKKKSIFIKFLEQFKNFMIIVLIIAAIISGVIGVIEGEGVTDSIIILIVVVANAIIGVVQESKAEKSLEALKQLSRTRGKSYTRWKFAGCSS